MAKSAGLGDGLLVEGVDLSGDIGSLSAIGGGPTPLEVTAINKSAFERIGGVRDGRIEFSAWFNPSVGAAHEKLSALPTGDQLVTYLRGTALGNQAAALSAKQVNYDPTRGTDGSLSIAVQALGQGFGLEWTRQLTAGVRTDAGATAGTGVDFGGGGSTAFGLQAYLHVVAFTGTSATITIEESSDDGAIDTYTAVTGGTFTAVTAAPFTERLETSRSQTVEQWLRVTTSGTFSDLQFAVVVERNLTETEF